MESLESDLNRYVTYKVVVEHRSSRGAAPQIVSRERVYVEIRVLPTSRTNPT